MKNESTKLVDTSLPLVIVNPKSASGSTRNKWSGVAADLRAHFGPFAVAFTKGPGDGTVIAEQAAKNGRKFIIACGGDGTINEVVNGIMNSGKDIELGILPSGTGGDFRRSVGMPLGHREAARALKSGITKRIDVGRVTFLDHDGNEVSRFFVNVSSAGLAAEVIKRVKSQKAFDWLPVESLRGKANFAASTLQEIVNLEGTTLRLKFDDGEEYQLRTIAFCVANARYFGGGMMIAPDAKMSDGLFDVVNISDLTTMRVIMKAPALYRGTLGSLKEVKMTTARRIEVAPASESEEILIETDGELPGKLPATYEIIPDALRIRVPRSMSPM
ncbi:MAG TPA: diacylglycerol kinase family protein [Pyrinomonadaceae bacterium]